MSAPQLDHASLICKTSSNVIVGKQEKVLVQGQQLEAMLRAALPN